jgi:hypothetical protein
MENIKGVIEHYITNKSETALLIRGDFGTGKTWFFRNILKGIIEEKGSVNNDNKNYKVIYMSLFGISSIDQIYKQLFLELFPFLKNKKVKIGLGIANMLLRAGLNYKNLSENGEILDSTGINYEDLANFENLFLCFDDLERKSKNFNLDEFLGFVNSLIDNQENIKVLLISNEDKLSDDEKAVLRDKLISNSIEFIPDYKVLGLEIIKNNFSSSNTIKNEFIDRYDLIYNSFFLHSTNLRTFNFALNHIHSIVSQLNINLAKEDLLLSKKEEYTEYLIKFICAIAIEYKLSKISFSQRNDLDKVGWGLDEYLMQKNNTVEKKATYQESFKEKYFNKNSYKFLTSVYNVITGYSTLDIIFLIQELKDMYQIRENDLAISREYELLDLLHHRQVDNIDDASYLGLTRELYNLIPSGNFELMSFLTLFYYVTRYDNPLEIDLNEFEKIISDTINKNIEKFAPIPEINLVIRKDGFLNHKEIMNRIVDYIHEANTKVISHLDKIEAEKLENDFNDNPIEFLKLITEKDSNYFIKPILKDFDIQNFIDKINSFSNKELYEFIKFLETRFNYGFKDALNSESDLVIELHSYFSHIINETNKGVKKNHCQEIINKLDEVIKQWKVE